MTEGCGGLEGENTAAFLKARPIFQQPFSLPEGAQTLAGIAFRAAGKSARNFPAASKFARKLFSSKEFRTATAFSSFLNDFQNGKFFEFLKLGILISICFGTRLGVSQAAPKGVSKRMGLKLASFCFEIVENQDRKKHINIKKYPENPPVRVPP